jgi:hypothetical protein
LEDELEKHKLPMTMLEPILGISLPMLPALIEQSKPMFRQLAEYLRSFLPKRLEDAVKSGHINVLKKDTLPDVRIQQYKDFTYEVVEIRESGLILGDSAILFNVDGSRPYKTFLEKNDIMNAVILPLTPNRFLIGACEDFAVSEHNWPEAIARCSLEYFIANENSDANRLLQESIAEDAALITKAELEEIITEIMNQ